MLNSTARRRVALAGVSLALAIGTAVVTGGCGVRPTATVGDPVIVPPGPTTTASSASTPSENPAPAPAPQPEPQPNADSPQVDPQRLLGAASGVEPNTALGAVVYDRVADHELVAVEPDRQFRSASLVKLLIAIDALHRGADAADRDRIARMLSVSDDDIASLLWVKAGGAALVTRAASLIGLQATEPPEVAGQWGEVKLTAHDMMRVYLYVINSLPPADHTLVVNALAYAPEYGADGFRQHFGIPDGLNAQWAIKQGWGNNSHAMVLHSTGLVGAQWRYIVVLLTEHPLGSGWKTCSESVTAAAGALNGQLPGV